MVVGNEKDEKVAFASFRVDPRMLDHFSVAMYKDAAKAISELVANSYDADASRVEITLPRSWEAKEAEVVIKDNGDGMTRDEIETRFLLLGYNKRSDTPRTAKGRKPMGSKGIGKLAGLGLAEVMRYSTTRGGVTSIFTIDREKLGKVQRSLEDYKIEILSRKTAQPKGTVVRLTPLHRDIRTLNPKSLREFLAYEFGGLEGFTVEVNGVPVVSEQLPGVREDIDEEIPGYGRVSGWYKILEKPARNPGFSVRVRGRVVKPRSTFSIGLNASGAINYAYIIGDVKADFLDSDTPTSKVEEFAISTDREGFNEASPSYAAFEDWVVGKLKSAAKTVKERRAELAKTKVKKSKTIKRSLGKLPDQVRSQTEALIYRIIEEIPWEEEEEIVELLKAVVDSVGSSETLLILRELAESNPDEVSGFVGLIGKFGLADMFRMAEHISARVEMIRQFERLIMTGKTLERKQIHPIIEDNIWLLSEDYTMMSSDEKIRTIIFRELGLEDAKEEDRPDFICRSRKKKLVVIEIKRGDYCLTAKDASQAFRYMDILKTYYPNTNMEAFMIGGSCKADQPTYGGFPVHMTAYPEVIEDAKDRYREFLDLLRGKKRSPVT